MKTEFILKKAGNAGLKDSLIAQGCTLVGSGKYAYNLVTQDVSLIPNQARVEVKRADYPGVNFADRPEAKAPYIMQELDSVTGQVMPKLHYPNLGNTGFISGKQFKQLHA